jgi:hypothetical protein
MATKKKESASQLPGSVGPKQIALLATRVNDLSIADHAKWCAGWTRLLFEATKRLHERLENATALEDNDYLADHCGEACGGLEPAYEELEGIVHALENTGDEGGDEPED